MICLNLNIGKEPVTLTYDPNGGFLNMPVIDTLSTDSAFFYPYEELLKELPKMEFSLRYGSSHTVDSCMFVRNDSIFTGWNTKADGSGTKYAPNDVIPNIQADMTLYAQWVHSPTAIPTIAKAAHSIVVYPNPTKGELRMESGEWRVLRFSIFSVENSQLSPLSILNSQLIRWIFRICRLVSTF